MASFSKQNVIRKYCFIYGMLAIGILHFLVFYLYVNFESFFLPFLDNSGNWSLGLIEIVWNNLKLGLESELLKNVKNTLIYYLTSLLTGLPISFFFAYGLYKKIKGSSFFNFIFLIPMMVSTVALSTVYKNMLAIGGPVSKIWAFITGKEAPLFLYDPKTATTSMVIYMFWTGFGLNLIMYAGALTRIPEDLWEQADLDGVGYMRGMLFIALPLVWPTFSMMMLLSAIGVFSADGPILLFTQGMYETSTLGYWMYEHVVKLEMYNYASAVGLFMTLATLPIFFIVNWLKRKLPADIQY